MKRESFRKGMKDGVPIALGYFAVSFTFGMMAVAGGFEYLAGSSDPPTNLTSAVTAAAPPRDLRDVTMTSITGLRTHDLRFHLRLARWLRCHEPDPDYSAAYVVLETDGALEGHGLTFTIGRGNEVVARSRRCAIA